MPNVEPTANMYVPAQHPMGGTREMNVTRPDCGHSIKLAMNMSSTNAITLQEQRRLQDVIANTPCEECARKEEKHV